MGWLARAALRLLGWRLVGPFPPVSRSVIVAAPHTSNLDVPLFVLAAYGLGVRIHFMVKHTAFRGPFAPLLRWIGAIPVHRADARRAHGLVGDAIAALRSEPSFHLALAPEGTRGRVRYWKRGFYEIARGAGVPVVLAFVDFRQRRVGVGPALELTGDVGADMARIGAFYSQVAARHPDRVGPVELRG
jgi:1-acyl-sn-glycerol-3-phosphate acyltransferase